MTSVYTSVEAAERRERRRQKILSNAQQRLSAILSGPDGKSRRPAPSVEIASSDGAVTPGSKARDNTATADQINFVKPQYIGKISSYRIYICIIFGILCRVAVAFGLIQNALPLFFAIFGPLTLYSLFRAPLASYPKHGYAVNFLLVGGWNECLVIGVGHALDIAWELGVDLLVVMFSYVQASIVFGAVA